MDKKNVFRALLPIVGLCIIFVIFNIFTNWRMISNLPLVLSQAYVVMISATGVFFIMTMGGLDFSQVSKGNWSGRKGGYVCRHKN